VVRAGELVYTLGYRDEAIGCFCRAAATGGKTNFGRLGMARALIIEDRYQEAEQILREMLVADPRSAMAYDQPCNLLSDLGRFNEAGACSNAPSRLHPYCLEVLRSGPVPANHEQRPWIA
jgi:predicted Zn-dependent protease